MSQKYWTKDRIKQSVLEIVNGLELKRMPSRQECDYYYQDTRLSNAITKNVGWYNLAKEMDLPIKESETQTGKSYEKRAKAALEAKGFEVKQMPQNFPYDLLVNNCVKVDVKASHLYKGAKGRFFTFRTGKPFTTCDVYLLSTLDDENHVEKTMIVPSSYVFNKRQISVGEHESIYYKFLDRYDLIANMVDYWHSLDLGVSL